MITIIIMMMMIISTIQTIITDVSTVIVVCMLHKDWMWQGCKGWDQHNILLPCCSATVAAAAVNARAVRTKLFTDTSPKRAHHYAEPNSTSKKQPPKHAAHHRDQDQCGSVPTVSYGLCSWHPWGWQGPPATEGGLTGPPR